MFGPSSLWLLRRLFGKAHSPQNVKRSDVKLYLSLLHHRHIIATLRIWNYCWFVSLTSVVVYVLDWAAFPANAVSTSVLVYILGAARFPDASSAAYWTHVPGLLTKSIPSDNPLRIQAPWSTYSIFQILLISEVAVIKSALVLLMKINGIALYLDIACWWLDISANKLVSCNCPWCCNAP